MFLIKLYFITLLLLKQHFLSYAALEGYNDDYYLFCYESSSNRFDWQDAKSYCQDYISTELATFHGVDDLSSFISLVQSIDDLDVSDTFWIGLSKRTNNDNLQWIDSSTIDYTNFPVDETTYLSQFNISSISDEGICGSIDMNGDWSMSACDTVDTHCFVCNFDSLTTTSNNNFVEYNTNSLANNGPNLIYQLIITIPNYETWFKSSDTIFFRIKGTNTDHTTDLASNNNDDYTDWLAYRGFYEYDTQYTLFLNWTNVGNVTALQFVSAGHDGLYLYDFSITNDFNHPTQSYALYNSSISFEPREFGVTGCSYSTLDMIDDIVIDDHRYAYGGLNCPYKDLYTIIINQNSDNNDISNNNGVNSSYVIVYDAINEYSWYEAKDYCMREYGSSLASIHSDNDYNSIIEARDELINSLASDASVNTLEYDQVLQTWTWIGLSDINVESESNANLNSSGWQWSDGTEYDYNGFWDFPDEPNDFDNRNEDCGQIFGKDRVEENDFDRVNDGPCNETQHSFVCGLNTVVESGLNTVLSGRDYWRPVFKLTSGLGGDKYNTYLASDGSLITVVDGDDLIDNAFEYYVNGTATFQTDIERDYEYVTSDDGFDGGAIETLFNYRSVLLDYDWDMLINVNKTFDKVKLSLFKDDIETKYWIYDVYDSNNEVTNIIDWFSGDYYVDSGYGDLITAGHNSWKMRGNYSRYWEISHNYDNCEDEGWMVVKDGNGGCSEWDPSEGQYSPELRYSVSYDNIRTPAYADYTDSSQNELADTMVIYINGYVYTPQNETDKQMTTTQTSFTSTPNSPNSVQTGTLTTETVTATTTEEPDSVDEEEQIVEQWESAGSSLALIILCATVFFMFVSFVYHRCLSRGADTPNFLSIFKFFSNVGDFWTDLIFTIILYYEASTWLFLTSLVCCGIPHLLSLIVCIYFIERWRHNIDDRLLLYLKKYDVFIIAGTIIGGFYAALELSQSRIFLHRAFHFPLKSDEYRNLKNVRFLNVVVLENIPQLMIQIIYASAQDNPSIIVYISMVFSVLSIIMSTSTQVSRICQIFRPRHLKFNESTYVSARLTIASKELRTYHQYARQNVEHAFEYVFDSSSELQDFRDRVDSSYDVEVFYISAKQMKVERKMIADFELIIYTHDSNVKNIFLNNLKNIGTEGHQNCDLMKRGISNLLKIDKETIGLDLKLKQATTQANDGTVDIQRTDTAGLNGTMTETTAGTTGGGNGRTRLATDSNYSNFSNGSGTGRKKESTVIVSSNTGGFGGGGGAGANNINIKSDDSEEDNEVIQPGFTHVGGINPSLRGNNNNVVVQVPRQESQIEGNPQPNYAMQGENQTLPADMEMGMLGR